MSHHVKFSELNMHRRVKIYSAYFMGYLFYKCLFINLMQRYINYRSWTWPGAKHALNAFISDASRTRRSTQPLSSSSSSLSLSSIENWSQFQANEKRCGPLGRRMCSYIFQLPSHDSLQEAKFQATELEMHCDFFY